VRALDIDISTPVPAPIRMVMWNRRKPPGMIEEAVMPLIENQRRLARSVRPPPWRRAPASSWGLYRARPNANDGCLGWAPRRLRRDGGRGSLHAAKGFAQGSGRQGLQANPATRCPLSCATPHRNGSTCWSDAGGILLESKSATRVTGTRTGMKTTTIRAAERLKRQRARRRAQGATGGRTVRGSAEWWRDGFATTPPKRSMATLPA